MEIVQWIVAAGTAAFVAVIGFFQWRTAQQKAALDLFERRHEIYTTVRESVGQMATHSQEFDQKKEIEFLAAVERAYFFFGDDVTHYLDKLWQAFNKVRAADVMMSGDSKAGEGREKAFNVVKDFYKVGQPLFGRYMRFDQKVS